MQAKIQPVPAPLLLPRHIGITDDYLFVYKEREEQLFALFRLPEASFITNAGNRGQGPNDFNLLDTRSFCPVQGGFKVMEAGTSLLKTVVFDGKELKTIHTENFQDLGRGSNGLYLLADSTYLTFGQIDGDNEFCILNRATKETVKTGTYPNWVDKDPAGGTPLFVTFIKSCVVHPDKEKVAVFYAHFKRLRIFDTSMNLLHDIHVKVPPYATPSENDGEKQAVYYIGQPYATKEHIYALCSNTLPSGETGHELQIWDWKGRPKARYKFDRKISMMAISEKYNKIFALDNLIADEMYIYDLPKPNFRK